MPVTHPSSSKRVGFVHIPKCDGTSIEWALGIAADYPSIGVRPTNIPTNNVLLFGGGLQHLTVRELRRDHASVWNALALRFSVLRDPVERMVSHFLWHEWRHSLLPAEPDVLLQKFKKMVEYAEGLRRSTNLLDDSTDGFEFESSVLGNAMPGDPIRHFLPQCAFLFSSGAIPIDRLYRLEHIDRLFSDLDALGVLQCQPEHRMKRQCHFEITIALRDRVRGLYTQDIRLLETMSNLLETDGGTFVEAGRVVAAMTP
jgi:hypothetical protein